MSAPCPSQKAQKSICPVKGTATINAGCASTSATDLSRRTGPVPFVSRARAVASRKLQQLLSKGFYSCSLPGLLTCELKFGLDLFLPQGNWQVAPRTNMIAGFASAPQD